MADSKLKFSTPPILNFFSRKFHGYVLGLVVLIDAKGIDVAQLIRLRDCLTKAQKQAKKHFWCFQAVLKLTLDNLTAIQVEPHQYPSHQSVLLTQGPIHEIFAKKSFFESAILLNSYENQSTFIMQQGWVEILMITLVYSKKVSVRNNLLHNVLK